MAPTLEAFAMGDVNIPENHYHDKLASVLARHIEGDDDVVVRTPQPRPCSA